MRAHREDRFVGGWLGVGTVNAKTVRSRGRFYTVFSVRSDGRVTRKRILFPESNRIVSTHTGSQRTTSILTSAWNPRTPEHVYRRVCPSEVQSPSFEAGLNYCKTTWRKRRKHIRCVERGRTKRRTTSINVTVLRHPLCSNEFYDFRKHPFRSMDSNRARYLTLRWFSS